MLVESTDISAEDFTAGTGWEIKPEGACKGEVCVPLGDRPGGFELATVAERLGMAVVRDDANAISALGPASIGDRALTTAEAPELILDDIDGHEFRFSSLRGRKVVIVSWAPY